MMKNPLKSDPTRTATLRRQFETEMVRRFAKFRRKLVSLIVDEDAFGLKEVNKSWNPVINSFCPTGEGGGVDPHCGNDGVDKPLSGNDTNGNGVIMRLAERHGVQTEEEMINGLPFLKIVLASDVEFWHGTARGSVQDIQKNGLKPYQNPGAGDIKAVSLGTREVGEWWTHTKADVVVRDPKTKKPTVGGSLLKVTLKKGTVVYQDPEARGSVFVREKISAKQIKEISTLSPDFSKGVDSGEYVHRIITNSQFSSTQLNVTDPECLRRIRELQGRLDPTDVIELETEPHVTVRYGILGQDPEVVQDLLKESGSVWMTIGRLSLFQQPEHDVLKLDVESKGLERLNAELGKLSNTTTHDNYEPHLTIARLKPGTGWKYLQDPSFLEWQSYVFTELTFSDKKRNHTEIALNELSEESRRRLETGLQQARDGQLVDGPDLEADALLVGNTRWAFRSSPEKIKEFLRWLEGNLRPILTDEATTDDDWWNKYVMAGFKKGAARSYDDMKKAGAIPQSNLPFYLGQKDEFLRSAFRQPESVEKVKLLAGRVYTELKGVTEAMSQNLTRTLTDGLVQGMNPRQIATNIVKDVNGIGIKRARLIARTEIIRAHAEGQLDSMERLGVKKLAVMVEWNTAGDARVCPLCRPLEGIVLTMDEAKGLLPRHVQCRCAWVPANVGEDQEEQVRGAARIKRAITKSLVAGKPKRGKSKSSWAGARRKISSFRPKSRV